MWSQDCHVGFRLLATTSAFSRPAQRSLTLRPARSPSSLQNLLPQRLQPLRCLHDCSSCFRPERKWPGGVRPRWKTAPLHGALRLAARKTPCACKSFIRFCAIPSKTSGDNTISCARSLNHLIPPNQVRQARGYPFASSGSPPRLADAAAPSGSRRYKPRPGTSTPLSRLSTSRRNASNSRIASPARDPRAARVIPKAAHWR